MRQSDLNYLAIVGATEVWDGSAEVALAPFDGPELNPVSAGALFVVAVTRFGLRHRRAELQLLRALGWSNFRSEQDHVIAFGLRDRGG